MYEKWCYLYSHIYNYILCKNIILLYINTNYNNINFTLILLYMYISNAALKSLLYFSFLSIIHLQMLLHDNQSNILVVGSWISLPLVSVTEWLFACEISNHDGLLSHEFCVCVYFFFCSCFTYHLGRCNILSLLSFFYFQTLFYFT